jgi:Domain of unknown function (DUF4396)
MDGRDEDEQREESGGKYEDSHGSSVGGAYGAAVTSSLKVRNGPSLWGPAVSATLHCLTGCAIGEVLGMVVSTALALGNALSIVLSTVLAFCFGYALTIRPLVAAGVGARRAVRLALASDTVSIATMEIVDNLFIVVVPGALAAALGDALFWWSLAVSLAIAFVVALPVNRWLIARRKGHAVVHFHDG